MSEPIYPKDFFQESEYVPDGTCFVLMPFRDEFTETYACIRSACDEAQIQCLRADEIFTPGPILTQILGRIARAKIIVADLTGANPNVFYELGIAHVVKRNVVLLAQDAQQVPFDLRHLRLLVYDAGNLPDLQQRLLSCIRSLTDEPPIALARPPRAAVEVLSQRNLADPSDVLFGRTDETSRLSMRRIDCSVDSAEPATSFAVFSAVPSRAVSLSLDLPSFKLWLDPNLRRYDPERGRLFIPLDDRRPQLDGVLAHESSAGTGAARWTRYLLIKFSGYCEYGGRFAYCNKDETYFTLTAIVSYLISFIRFVEDFSQLARCEITFQPYLTLVGTKGAQLSHLGKGWREPWDAFGGFESRCGLTHVQVNGERVKPDSSIEEVFAIVKQMAAKIDNAFGVWESRAFNHPNAGNPDELNDSAGVFP